MESLEKIAIMVSTPAGILAIMILLLWKFVAPSLRLLFHRLIQHFDTLEGIQQQIRDTLLDQNNKQEILNSDFKQAVNFNQGKLDQIHKDVLKIKRPDSDSIPNPHYHHPEERLSSKHTKRIEDQSQ